MSASKLPPKKILFLMSGSIACYKACAIVSSLAQQGDCVQVAMTTAATAFVGTATLEGLTGNKVLTGLFEPGTMMEHIHQMRTADLIILAPATANTLNKFAAGIGDDLLGTLFLAYDFKRPFLIAPAMNSSMYEHPATQASIIKLKQMGIQFIAPEHGTLACGEVGAGRMAEPEIILQKIASLVSPKMKNKKKILITGGGTTEAIDEVRSITNTSTGKTGSIIADYLASELSDAYDIIYLAGKNSMLPKNPGIEIRHFTDYQSIENLMKVTLATENIHTLIMVAAVSDYSVAKVESNGVPLSEKKISTSGSLTIHLQPNPKIINQVKFWSKNDLQVISFKLTSGISPTDLKNKIAKQLESSDLVIHNDLSEMSPVKMIHPYHLYTKNLHFINESIPVESPTDLAKYLKNYVSETESTRGMQ